MILARSRRTRAWAPVSAFFNIDQFMKDIDVIVDSGRGRPLSLAQVGLSFLRNFDERKAPPGLTVSRVIELVRSRLGGPKAAGGRDPEISFCAYNSGVGWRQIVENMHMVATTRDWFKQKGRHTIYAGDRPIPLPDSLKRRLPVVAVEDGRGGPAQARCGTGCGCL